MSRYYDARIYDWDETDTVDYTAAYGKAREWDYNNDARIGLGVMYRHDAPLFEESYPVPYPLPPEEKMAWVRKIMDERG